MKLRKKIDIFSHKTVINKFNKDNKINISKKYATKVLSSDIVRSTIFDNAVYTFNGGEYVNSFSLEN